MNKPNVTKYFNVAKRFAIKRSPELLTGIGVAGMITTTVLAVKATPKALELIEEEKRRQDHERFKEASANGDEEYGQVTQLKPLEVVKVAWKPYVPAVVTGLASVGCLIGANSVSARRHAALYSAYKLSETALTEYKEKVVETIGEKKEKTIREKIRKDKLENNPASKSQVIITGGGDQLFYDPLSDRYFRSDIETVRKTINDLNYAMTCGTEMYVSLSELYDELGLKRTTISDDVGWNVSNGLIEPEFDTQLSDDGKACVVLDFLLAPTYKYDSLY